MAKRGKETRPLNPQEFALLLSVFVVAACGLIYELAAGALASYLLGDSVLQFSTVIGSYLFAMGIGSYLSRFVIEDIAAVFLRVELMVGLVGGLMPAALYLLHSQSLGSSFLGFRLALYGLVLLVGILVGLEIPLVMRLMQQHYALKDLVSQVLTFDYLGALVVSIAFPLLLVPQLGLIRTGLFFGLLNAFVALWALWIFRNQLRNFKTHVISSAAVCGILLTAFVLSEHITTHGEERFYGERIAITHTTPYQRIVLTQSSNGAHWRLFLNGHLQFNTRDEYRYHEALVHPVMAAHPAPKRVLVLGGGDGMAVREVLKYPSVEQVTLVELDPEMTTLFKDHPQLAKLNKGALHSPKVRVVNGDAFQWLDQESTQAGNNHQDDFFDIVIVDFPDPTNYAIGKLYTTHFYQLLAKRLRATGFAVIQTTSPLMARQSYWTVATTLEAAELQTHPYHAFVPSFGEWGFIVASHKPHVLPQANTASNPIALRLPAELRFINTETLPLLFDFPQDMSRIPAPVNRLSNQSLVDIFQREWGRHN
jgi:spermidine synthase